MTRMTRMTRPTTKTSLVTGTTGTTGTVRDDEQTTGGDTHVRQHPETQPQPRAETQTAYLPRTALGVIAVNWK
jgi:hypothetical protein